jgi:predicted glycosyltransferase
MNILVQLSHPAHFHLYKEVAKNLINQGNKVLFVIKSKDILEQLLQNAGLPYVNINQHAHRGSKLGILWDMFVREWRIIKLCRKHKIDLLTGSTPEVAHVAWLLRKSVVNTTEDDATVIGAVVKALCPFIKCMLAPIPCEMGKLEKHTTHYPGYHELAYLHPNHFTASQEVVSSYGIDTAKLYFILRFASLNAHHDDGIKGINTEVAQRLIDTLSPHGQIYITSERPLEPQFEQYRIRINPLDMHDVMAFASLYIGDSQTMAAEAGVLGVPFVRFNDFVGRIGYLRELEDIYELGYGIHATPLTEESPIRRADGSVQPSGVEQLYSRVEQLVAMPAEQRRTIFTARREKMLADKIDCAKFLTWFIENYPASAEQTKIANATSDATFWQQFK